MTTPLRIAIMVRAYIPMPRPVDMIYAPIDLAVATARGLAARGHQVTLFAPLGTTVHGDNINVESLNLRPLIETQADFAQMLGRHDDLMHDMPGLWDRYMTNAMLGRAAAGEFDIVWLHHPETALSSAGAFTQVPVVYTLHDPILPQFRELYDLYQSPNQFFVSISENQRRDAPDLPYAATVYNGTDSDMFGYSDEAEDYLLYTGRITPEKGVKEAIQVARAADHRLLIIGPYDDTHKGYFEQYIKPELDDKILYLGRVDHDRLPKYYQKARALLTPVQWEEPFGLTTIEAMACGTPVISLQRGAAPELIVDGKTGYVVSSVAEMTQAVAKIDRIKRRDCHDHVRKHFSVDRMVDMYENVFSEIVKGSETMPPRATMIEKQLKKKLGGIKRLLGS